jgi:hypothetical protein
MPIAVNLQSSSQKFIFKLLTMKKMALFVVTSILITACNKGGDGVDPAQLEHYPQTWILTVDKAPDKYVYLKANSPVMYRDDILRSYSLTQLADDHDCQWEVNTSRTEFTNEVCYTIRLKKNKKLWLGATPSSNKQEIHLIAPSYNTNDLDDDSYNWFIHKMADVNGVKTVVLENVFYKGYYVSSASPGFQFAQNLATLQQATSPAKATAWQCR